ncbi:MAG: helix-turn-helix transcriptional regulator [Clostridia bacterium]|nr:helix-turn-helix transcriptional regulator [Clostridia bacterium]
MFSALLKELREKAGLTQGRIAEILDTPVRTYGSWERGERQPDFDTLIKIADYYHVSTDYLLGRVQMGITVKKETPPAKSDDEYEVVIHPQQKVPDAKELERLILSAVKKEIPNLIDEELKKRGM